MSESNYIFQGKDVRVCKDHSLEVCARKGIFKKTEQWHRVMPSEIDINTYHFNTIDTRYGRHSIADLGVSAAELSHLLGVDRLDTTRAQEIREAPSSVKGEHFQIDVERKEFARGGLVYPFNAVEKIVTHPAPHVVAKWHEAPIAIGQLPISLQELSRVLDVPIIDTE